MPEIDYVEKFRDDWYKENNLQAKTRAINGSALPLIADSDVQGILFVSGLHKVEEPFFVVEVSTKFVARDSKEP